MEAIPPASGSLHPTTAAEPPIRASAAPPGPSPRPPVRVRLQRKKSAASRRWLRRTVLRVAGLVVADVVALLCLLAVASASWVFALGGGLEQMLLIQALVGPAELASALVVGLWAAGAYGEGIAWSSGGRILKGVMLGAALVVWSVVWDDGPAVAALVWLLITLSTGLALGVERALLDVLVPRLPFSRRGREHLLLVGDLDSDAAGWVRATVGAPEGAGDGLGPGRGLVLSQEALAGGEDLPGLAARIESEDVDSIVVVGRFPAEFFEAILEVGRASGARVLTPSYLDALGAVLPRRAWVRDVPLVELTVPTLQAGQLAVKRVMDVFGAVAALLVLSPLLAVLAAAVKLDSRGPVLFRQDRVGLGGTVFGMLKFRTMHVGADAAKGELEHLNRSGDPRLFKIPDDPRITRLGRLLRRWSLDELPQLWNVLRGDMSLVGPRPFFEDDFALYAEHHFERLSAKPGITGLWQVAGRSEITDFEKVVRLDTEYIDRWSPWLDIRILLLTVPAVLRRSGAF